MISGSLINCSIISSYATKKRARLMSNSARLKVNNIDRRIGCIYNVSILPFRENEEKFCWETYVDVSRN